VFQEKLPTLVQTETSGLSIAQTKSPTYLAAWLLQVSSMRVYQQPGFPLYLCCRHAAPVKVIDQDIDANQEHPQRKDQQKPFSSSDAQ
jgi:hypothetical protein